ncbi:MAG TPA: YegS/Rv2252/BmrU family lipid kinase [Candidatus Limnocylindrales bacterium]|jgi:YegS/Rv2252/BmrU family lipid kinase|nr:YegS/Rv2252/BmrU family lipid kinase [Candidatus Limnocylindrales bacterium]
MGEPAVRVIAHPGAGRGAFSRRWPPVAAALEAARIPYRVELTAGAAEAARLARGARDEGARLVVAVGGDGTLHEVVNGLLHGDDRLPDEPGVGLVPAGRGSDYARGLRLPTDPAALAIAFRAFLDGDPAAAERLDAGEVTYRPGALVAGRLPADGIGGRDPAAGSTDPDRSARRRFINAAGVGFSPFVAQRTARFPARLGAYLYTAAAILTIVDWRDRRLRLRWDDGQEEERALESVEVLLAPYEGGGMLVAPGADPTDGCFDVLLLGAVSRPEMLTFAWRVRTGAHLSSPRVELKRTGRLGIEAVDSGGPIYLQADGELLGREPFEFRVLPAALRIVGAGGATAGGPLSGESVW